MTKTTKHPQSELQQVFFIGRHIPFDIEDFVIVDGNITVFPAIFIKKGCPTFDNMVQTFVDKKEDLEKIEQETSHCVILLKQKNKIYA